jgi:hypothetical protein
VRDEPHQFLKIVAQILPRELDATLSVSVEFTEAKNFAEYYGIA